MRQLLLRWILGVAFITTVHMTSAAAQTGTITGTVSGPGGALLPGALITITNVDNNFERTFVTDDHGDYTFLLLPSGMYRLEAALLGFRTDVAENIFVSVDDHLRIDFTLRLGLVSERVTVTATSPLLQSETSSVGVVIDNQKVAELSLNGRQFESLAQLVPGSVSPAPGSALSFRGGFNAAGARETANSNLLDGVDNNDPAINNFTLRPILDAIQEFKVLSNSYSAEFGRSGGAQVIVSTVRCNLAAPSSSSLTKVSAADRYSRASNRFPRRQCFGGTSPKYPLRYAIRRTMSGPHFQEISSCQSDQLRRQADSRPRFVSASDCGIDGAKQLPRRESFSDRCRSVPRSHRSQDQQHDGTIWPIRFH